MSDRDRLSNQGRGKQKPENAVLDAVDGNWVDRFAPLKTQPFLRLMRADRPIGIWLLFWPCAWSLTLASMERGDGWLNLWYLRALVLFLIGAVVMRGAGCVWNDITDREIDAKVARTRSRPIPSGQVSVRQALLFMVALALAGLLVLVQFNQFTIVLGFCSVLPVLVYPFMKRITSWPQMVLGLALGWGALMGGAARLGTLEIPSLLLYLGTICWIVGFDTIYAHQDREDDALIGMKSTALKFGESTKTWLGVFFGVAVLLLFAAILLTGSGTYISFQNYSSAVIVTMYLGMSLATGLLLWQIMTLDIDDPDNCLRRFRHSNRFGLVVFATLIAMWLVQNISIGRTYWTPWF